MVEVPVMARGMNPPNLTEAIRLAKPIAIPISASECFETEAAAPLPNEVSTRLTVASFIKGL
ncbi:hypothetical protein [Treponema pedis]|uniref:hypothetical protein n=1 Tax=Treponema pedis TaxID=409322 RepID=UPI003D1B0B0E